MLYIKIFLISLVPVLMFGQSYYTGGDANTFYQLLLNDNKTFSYSEQSPIGTVTVSVTGTYDYSNNKIIASGTDSRNNRQVQITISLNGNTATISINGQTRILTKR